MFKFKWVHTNITTQNDIRNMKYNFNKCNPTIGAFDTETTGLHIKLDKPFLFQFGWVDYANSTGYTYLVDLVLYKEVARKTVRVWNELASKLVTYLAHNITFDLHMLDNTNLPYKYENMSDFMFYIRYAHNAVQEKHGGPPLALKEYCARYIDISAKYLNKELRSEQSLIAKTHNARLKNAISDARDKIEATEIMSWIKETTFDIEDLDSDLQEIYKSWKSELPDYLKERITGHVESKFIRYDKLDRNLVYKYAHMDIQLVLEGYYKLSPVVQARGNQSMINLENSLILPFKEMEDTGFKADLRYIRKSKIKMKTFIKKKKDEFWSLLGQKVRVGQHQKIKQIIKEKYNIQLESTSEAIVSRLIVVLKRDEPESKVIRILELMQEIRSLDKWYSAYILRFEKDLIHTDKLYPTINSVGTISGRITSDFQQFPKYALTDDNGNEIYHPRKIVIVGDNPNFDSIVYIDYSQIELRVGAMYTILVDDPDLNMCRAYMPYKCFRWLNSNKTNSEDFDYHNKEHIENYDKYEWFLEEDVETKWHPVDLHAATTKTALKIDESHPDFKKKRTDVGKKINFMKQYRAGERKIAETFPDNTPAEHKIMNNSYYETFPGVKSYHKYCDNSARLNSYTANLFGTRYYGISGHNLSNLLIQGSSAIFLKLKIRELYDYIHENNIKTKMQMQIHDELSFVKHKDEGKEVVYAMQKIMQDWSDALVPIAADLEITYTNWAEKEDFA